MFMFKFFCSLSGESSSLSVISIFHSLDNNLPHNSPSFRLQNSAETERKMFPRCIFNGYTSHKGIQRLKLLVLR